MADRRRAVLLIHDMQNYFVEPFGAPLRETLVANIAALRTHCAAVGIPVAYSAQPGGMSEEQRGLLLDFWGPGMQLTPKDRDIVDVLTPQPADWLVTKWRYSAFFNNDLLKKIHAANRDQLIICGVYAHIGVLTTALEAYSNDIQVLFVADATGDFKQDDHRQALKHASRTCAALTTTEEVIRCLG
ncbi:isochorismatase family protein [Roseospira marina]|nr:isochorismatase family protein [Roseospira marina]MBB4316015.1 isochorismate hydrolase [Roseospira marina]